MGYAFHLAVLTVLAFIATALTLVLGGLGLTLGSAKLDGFANLGTLFTIGSIAVRESWGVIDFAKKLTIQYYRVREIELRNEADPL